MSEFHEPPEELSEETRSYRRAVNTLMEELEAVDWYQQRMDATKDENLYKILSHNRSEEMEHACMTLEWMRRNMPGWDEQLRTYLFTEGDITTLEEDETEGDGEGSGSTNTSSGDLSIGKIDKQ